MSDKLATLREMFDRAGSRYHGRFHFALSGGAYAGCLEFERKELPQLIAALREIEASA
jgi:hypothetical protein